MKGMHIAKCRLDSAKVGRSKFATDIQIFSHEAHAVHYSAEPANNDELQPMPPETQQKFLIVLDWRIHCIRGRPKSQAFGSRQADAPQFAPQWSWSEHPQPGTYQIHNHTQPAKQD